jgi:hypothetical protein
MRSVGARLRVDRCDEQSVRLFYRLPLSGVESVAKVRGSAGGFATADYGARLDVLRQLP